MIYLKSAGQIEIGDDQAGDTPDRLTRQALLVYAGEFESMDGPVTVSDDHIEKLVSNYNTTRAKLRRLAKGKPSVKGCPPVQLDHTQSARDTVGRVDGELYVGNYVNDKGISTKAAFCKGVTFLGKENCEKVRDGRWQDLSIGADLEEGVLSELSVTPFPAAKGAALLSKRRLEMDKKKMVAYLMANQQCTEDEAKARLEAMTDKEKTELHSLAVKEKLSNAEDLPENEASPTTNPPTEPSGEGATSLSNAEDAPDSATEHMACDEDKMKSYLMDKDGMDEDSAKEKLAGMDDEEKKELTGRIEEDEKKLSNAEELPENEASPTTNPPTEPKGGVTMSAANTKKFTQLAGKWKKKASSARLAAIKITLSARLSSLKASGKITPAEIKNIDLDKLSRGSKESIEMVMESYEAREPVILAGAMGSVKASSLADLQKDVKFTSLEDETRANMTMFSKGKKPQQKVVDIKLAHEMTPKFTEDFEGICQLMDAGKIKEAKVLLSRVLKSDTGSAPKGAVALSGLAKEVESLQNDFEELISLVSPN